MSKYTIELDGDQWFCHDEQFINLAESDRYVFAPTPLEALEQFLEAFETQAITVEQQEEFDAFMGGNPLDGFPELKRSSSEKKSL